MSVSLFDIFPNKLKPQVCIQAIFKCVGVSFFFFPERKYLSIEKFLNQHISLNQIFTEKLFQS